MITKRQITLIKGATGLTLESVRRGNWDTVTPEELAQSASIRDILGNPFRPLAIEPAWFTETVTAIARHIEHTGEYGAMPILADALQDAGCDNEELLEHCRREGAHVRGCWVLDLLMSSR